MTPEQFTYWLQGFIEACQPTHLTTRQFELVKEKLASVFDPKQHKHSENPLYHKITELLKKS
jgi:hypothetical protein